MKKIRVQNNRREMPPLYCTTCGKEQDQTRPTNRCQRTGCAGRGDYTPDIRLLTWEKLMRQPFNRTFLRDLRIAVGWEKERP